MLAYAVKPAVSWYTMVIREHDGSYREIVEPHQPDKAKILVDLRNDYAFKRLFGMQ